MAETWSDWYARRIQAEQQERVKQSEETRRRLRITADDIIRLQEEDAAETLRLIRGPTPDEVAEQEDREAAEQRRREIKGWWRNR